SLARGVAEGRGELKNIPRIAVIGSPGSGKSTLARQIAARTGHPLIHLDYHFWQPGWVMLPKDERRAMQEQWVQGERWIIDGNYNGTLELRFAAADLVICLDLPPLLCLWRVFRRHGKQRPDMRVVEGGRFTRDALEFFWFILRFRRDSLPKILALHKKYPNVAFLRVRSAKEAKNIANRGSI
ncbi:MAG: hypothetical protein FWC27_10555, partial [Firmicutes bacterium]|nr:hypothetical protein [Bacillota bacterium]